MLNWELQRGFSFIEMITTLLLVSVIVAISAPSYLESQKTALIKKTTIELLSMFEVGQSEALIRRRPVYVHYLPSSSNSKDACFALSLNSGAENACNENNGMQKLIIKNENKITVTEPKKTTPTKLFYFSSIHGLPSVDKTIKFSIDTKKEKVFGILIRRYAGVRGCSNAFVTGWETCETSR